MMMKDFRTLKSAALTPMLTLGQYHIAWLLQICNII